MSSREVRCRVTKDGWVFEAGEFRAEKTVGPFMPDEVPVKEVAERLGVSVVDVAVAMARARFPGRPVKVEFDPSDAEAIRLTDVGARHVGRKVRFRAFIAAEGAWSAVPRHVRVGCGCDAAPVYDLSKAENYRLLRDYLLRPYETYKCPSCKRRGRLKPVEGEGAEWIDCVKLRVRPVAEEADPERLHKTLMIYLVGQRAPVKKEAELCGYVEAGRGGVLTAVCFTAEPAEAEPVFTEEDFKEFKKFSKLSEEELTNLVVPGCAGRPTAKLAILLTLHSPRRLVFEGEEMRGWLNTLFLGDTTTYKSRSLKWLANQGFGPYCTAELASEVGLTVAVDPELNELMWGILPQQHGRLALIDGLQNLGPTQMAALREAMRMGRVVVRKKVAGEALTETRIIAAANPPKPLDEYRLCAEALAETRCFLNPVDIARWDLIVRFKDDDVPAEEIAHHRLRQPPIPFDILKKHVLWAWSLTPDQVVFTEEAEKAVDKAYVEFMEFAYSKLPLIHRGYKETIARVAAAYAVLRHSVEKTDQIRRSYDIIDQLDQLTRLRREGGGGLLVVVRPEHVEWAVEYLWHLLELWDYAGYVIEARKEEELTDEEYEKLKEEFESDEILRDVFEAIVEKSGITCTMIQKKVNISRQTVIDRAHKLKAMGLVSARERSRGYRLTAKGVKFAKKLTGGTPTSLREKSGQLVKLVYPNHESDISDGRVIVKPLPEPYHGRCGLCGEEQLLEFYVEIDGLGCHACRRCRGEVAGSEVDE